MRIESVTATSFGPFRGEVLDLAPGLTVVHGDNESGKSSWHAAIYAAFCGRRRARGRANKEDARFAELHRPWTGDSWKVRCIIVLDDGRRIELAHDLDGKVDCRAVDMSLGRDVSDEIVHDGAPDGSRWLGLNRRTFAATACIEQADLLSVLAAAHDMQGDLQRAAATAGRDETAAQALQAIKDFRSERVGLDRVNSTRPLRRAKLTLEQADRDLTHARQQHLDYVKMVAAAEGAREQSDRARKVRSGLEQQVDLAEQIVKAARTARLTRQEAERAECNAAEASDVMVRLEERLARATELSDVLGDYVPATATKDDELAQKVAAAASAWRSAPAVGELTGPASADIQAEIDALPDPPVGDLEVDAEVRRRYETWRDAVAVAESSQRGKPDPLRVSGLEVELRKAVTARDFTASEVRIAEAAETEALEAYRPEVSPARDLAPGASKVGLAVGILGLVIGVVGLILLVMGNLLPGLVIAVLGLAGVVWAWVRRPSSGPRLDSGPRTAASPGPSLGAARERLHRARCQPGGRGHGSQGCGSTRERTQGGRRCAASRA